MKNAGYVIGLTIALAISSGVFAQPDSGPVSPPPPAKVASIAAPVAVPTPPSTVPKTAVAVPPAPATPSTAPAATVTEPEVSWWKLLIRYGLELIFTILGIMATAFVTVLMRKYGFEDYTAKVNDILARGIGYAEQKSAQALKLNGKPLAGAEKLALALDMAVELAKQYKLPDRGKEWWTAKVEGWLGVNKISNGSK